MRRAQNARTIGFSRMAISAATTNTNTAPFTADTKQPRAHHDQRQAHELNPPRDQDLPRAVWRHRGHRSSRPSGGIAARARGTAVAGPCALAEARYPLPWHP